MLLTIGCPKCQAVYRLGVEWSGKNIQCTACGSDVAVPKMGPSPTPTTREEIKEPRTGSGQQAQETRPASHGSDLTGLIENWQQARGQEEPPLSQGSGGEAVRGFGDWMSAQEQETPPPSRAREAWASRDESERGGCYACGAPAT